MQQEMKAVQKVNNTLSQKKLELIFAGLKTIISHLCYIFGLLKITKPT